MIGASTVEEATERHNSSLHHSAADQTTLEAQLARSGRPVILLTRPRPIEMRGASSNYARYVACSRSLAPAEGKWSPFFACSQ